MKESVWKLWSGIFRQKVFLAVVWMEDRQEYEPGMEEDGDGRVEENDGLCRREMG